MATTQEYIQSLLPATANNGNPNTVYNAPNMNAQGNLFASAVNPAAVLQGLQLPQLPSTIGLGGWVAPTPMYTGNTGYALPVFNGFTTNPNWTPGVTPGTPQPPAVTPPAGGGGGGSIGGGPAVGGGGAPGGGGNQYMPPMGQPGTGMNWGGAGGLGGTGTFGGGYTTNMTNSAFGGPESDGSGAYSLRGSQVGGAIDWNQMIDAAADVLGFGGNWYLDNVNRWDASNAISSFLSSVTGLPVGNIMTMIGKFGAQRGWSDNNMFVDHYLDNLTNQLQGRANQGSRRMQSDIIDNLNTQFDEMLNSYYQRALDGASVTDRPLQPRNPSVTVGPVSTVDGGAGPMGNNMGNFQNIAGGIGAGYGGSGAIGLGTGLFGGGTGNFGGSGTSGGLTQAQADWATQQAFGGSAAGNTAGQAAAAGAGAGAGAGGSGFGRGQFGASVLTGDAARSAFAGMRDANSRALAKAEYDAWVRAQQK